ncbi:MAG TPA: alpha/beta fold hydrolase [Ktedonobacterales bacterium]|nr:alpha/beta fold hydrolase [Ktedonobacterales bacterium]
MKRTDVVSRTDQTLQLPDGRTLGFAEYGSPEGNVLVYCHGYPGSRLEAATLSAHAAEAHVRVVSLDRPGFGRSSFQEGRSLLDWPHDLVAVTERLGIDRFAVMGVSGGAPYALACAQQIPERLLSCGIVSAIAPVKLGATGMDWQNRVVVFLVNRTPWLFTRLLGRMARSARDEQRARDAMIRTVRRMARPDREVLQAPGVIDELAASAGEVYRQGVQGAASEARLYARDWGFQLEDIAFQPLYLWHGARDTFAPIERARAVAGKLAHCQATYYPDEGHFSTLLNHQPEFFAALFSPPA